MAFEGYGDLSLTELLPAILTRYSETRLLIAAPSLPEQATDVIARWMRKQWARMDGKGRLDVIAELTVVTDTELSPGVREWLEQDTFGSRLTVVDGKQDDTVILLPDFAITGPVNMRYDKHFTAEATTEEGKVRALWELFRPKLEEVPAPTSGQAQGTPLPEEKEPEPVAPPAETEASGRPKPKAAKRQKKDAE